MHQHEWLWKHYNKRTGNIYYTAGNQNSMSGHLVQKLSWCLGSPHPIKEWLRLSIDFALHFRFLLMGTLSVIGDRWQAPATWTMWETQMGFLAPGFVLAQSHLLQAFQKWTTRWKFALSPSPLYISFPNKARKKSFLFKKVKTSLSNCSPWKRQPTSLLTIF